MTRPSCWHFDREQMRKANALARLDRAIQGCARAHLLPREILSGVCESLASRAFAEQAVEDFSPEILAECYADWLARLKTPLA